MTKTISKLLIINIIMICLMPNVLAYTAGSTGGGDSFETGASPCGNDTPCESYGTYFQLRLTLVDKNKNLAKDVTGTKTTKTIQFIPYQPAAGGGPWVNYNKYNLNTVATDPYRYISDYHYSEQLVFYGSSIPTDYKTQDPKNNGYDNTEHVVYMGFGDNNVETTNFADYSKLRQEFERYATNISAKKNYVEGVGNISFIDYFLHVCGFTDSWKASEDYETLKAIKEKQYYILVEPVYHLGTMYFNNWHNVEGTAKQIGWFSLRNNYGYICTANQGPCRSAYVENLWSVTHDTEILSNLFCNFYDNSEIFRSGSTTAQGACYKYLRSDYLDEIAGQDEINRYHYIFNWLANSYDPFGVNVLDLQQVFKSIDATKTCVLETSSCNDNGFRFSSRLLSKDENNKTSDSKESISACVFELDETDRNKFFNSYGADQNQMWCYDDVTYDFSQIKKMDNKEYSSGTSAQIPSGILTVNRTCYSTKQINDTSLLDSVLNKDNVGNKQYQNTFILKLNNKNLYFKRNDTVETIRQYSESKTQEKKSKYNKYIYASTFRYYYEPSDTEGIIGNNKDLNINILNYDAFNGQTDNTSIKLPNSNNGKTMIVPKIDDLYKEYNNTFEAKEPGKTETGLKNAYGLSTKIYEQLGKSKIKSVEYADRNQTKYTLLETNTKINFEIASDEDKVCEFKTTIRNTGMDNGKQGPQFRVISLSNPFPARDGTSRLPGENWLNSSENNVYDYIENNRNVSEEKIYEQEPLYTITLDTQAMVRIREYNKSHNYSQYDITCETGTGRMCISNFLRNTKYINNLEGTCSSITQKEITNINKKIIDFENSGCNQISQCMSYRKKDIEELDANKDGYVTSDDLLNTDFYTCADKTSKSGG